MAIRPDLNHWITRLEDAKDTVLPQARDIPGIRELAEVLGPTLSHPSGTLAAEVTAMWSTIRSWPRPELAAFVVRPHSSMPAQQKIWRLRLLVLVAQGRSQHPRQIIPADVVPKLSLDQITEKARAGFLALIDQDGVGRVIDQLVSAIRHLIQLLPRGIVLDGRYVVLNGRRIAERLTPQARLFLDILIAAGGRTVSRRAFEQQGVCHPAMVKSRLLQVPEFSILGRYIEPARPGGFRLSQP